MSLGMGGNGSLESYARAALDRECEMAARTGHGRNDQLNRSAFSIGQLVGAGVLDRSEAERRLMSAAEASGYIAKDGQIAARNTIKSGLDKGACEPRRLPESCSSADEPIRATQSERRRLEPKLEGVPLPDWTEPNVDGKPKLVAIGKAEPPRFDGEIRRHHYLREGEIVRCKVKQSTGTKFVDWYRVRRPSDGAIGWQARKPAAYVPVPYTPDRSSDPFKPERRGEVLAWSEGEKDADALYANGFLAFTFGGTSDTACGDLLRGQHVLIVADNDEPGEKCIANKIEASVLSGAASIRVVRFADMAAGADVADFFAAGHTAEDLLDRATPAKSEAKAKDANGSDEAKTGSTGEDQRYGWDASASQKGKGSERATLNHQGLLVSMFRDRLDVALSMDAAHRFPTASLPPLMRDMVMALVEHVQAPESLCAHSVLGAVTLVSQGLADIEAPGVGRAMPLSLFMLAIAASGERKSSCDGMALQGVAKFEAALQEPYDEDMRRYRADKAAFDGEVSKIKSDRKIEREERQTRLRTLIEPKEPPAPILRAEEPNLEGLLNLLVRGRPSVGVYTAEGGSFLGGHGMNEDAKTRTLTGLSRLYDNGSGQRVRAKELSIIKGCRVSISIAVQAKIAAALLGDELAQDQGFLGRFLICYPESTIGTRQVRPSTSDGDARVTAFVDRTERLLELQDTAQAPLRLPTLGLDDLAWQVWQAFAQSIEDQLGRGGIWWPIRATAQRISENIARLAGVLHLFCQGKIDEAVSGETMATACDIGGFYLKEALRISGGVILDAETQAVNDLVAWLESRSTDLISPTILQQTAPRPRMNAKTARDRIRALCEAGILDLKGQGNIDGVPYREVYQLIRRGRH